MTITKEFASALVMTGLIAFFACQVNIPQEEFTRLAPKTLLWLLVALNVVQYVLAFIRYRQKSDKVLSLKGYPLKRVTILLALTVLFVAVADRVGFYLASLVYFFLASLIAQPMAITPKLLVRRFIIVLACIGFLYGLFTVALNVQIPRGFLGF